MALTAVHLIDGNSIGYASHLGTTLRNGTRQTQAIFGCIRSMRALQIDNPRSKKVVLWDGTPKWRKDLYPEYKESRKKSPEQLQMRADYAAQKPDIRRAFTALGIDQVISPNCEADDLAAAYVQLFWQRGLSVTMITGDRDWLQLVRERVDWYDPIHDKYCNLDNFKSITGYDNSLQFVDSKALEGDVSDNIKGVGGIGEVGAAKMIGAYGGVARFLRLYDVRGADMAGLPAPWIKFAENIDGRRDRYFRNLKLMELKPGVTGVKDFEVTKGVFNPEDFRKVAQECAFLSITNQFNEWVKPFALRSAA